MVTYIRAEIQARPGRPRRPSSRRPSKGLGGRRRRCPKKFLDENPTPSHGPRGPDAASAGSRRRKGRLAIDAIGGRSRTPRKHAELQKMAIQAYADAGKYYTDTIDKLKGEAADRVAGRADGRAPGASRVLIDHAEDQRRRRRATEEAADAGQRRCWSTSSSTTATARSRSRRCSRAAKCLTELGDYKQAGVEAPGDRSRCASGWPRRRSKAQRVPQQDHLRRLHRAGPGAPAGGQAERGQGVRRPASSSEDKTLEKEWAGPALKLEKAGDPLQDEGRPRRDGAGQRGHDQELATAAGSAIAKDKMKRWGEGGVPIRFSPEADDDGGRLVDRPRQLPRRAARLLRRCIEACVDRRGEDRSSARAPTTRWASASRR